MAFRTWATIAPIVTAGGLLALLGRAEPAQAHPHVWIDAVVTFVFEDGQLIGLRHHWRFDEFFGSYVIEEHDANGDGVLDAEEVRAIRDAAFSNLREYDYFTHVRVNGERLPLHEVSSFTARIEDGILVYEFEMPLPEAVQPGALAASVYDEEYYVEVLLDEHDPVRFEGILSGGCTYQIREDAENPIYSGWSIRWPSP